MGNVQDIREPKGAKINLKGREMTLRFDLNSFALLEEHYGDIDQAMEALEKGSVKAVRAILWAGLLHENLDKNGEPTISVREVGSMIEIKDLPYVGELLGEALGQAMPQAVEGEVGKSAPLSKKGKPKK